MKKNKLYIAGLLLLGATASCSDFLEPDSPSKFGDDYVISNTVEANRLLNGVYQSLMSNDTYGKAFLSTFCFSSDVEFYTTSNEMQDAGHSEYRQFDCEADAGSLLKTWNAAYSTIERANNFVTVAENSALYAQGNEELRQMVGEAKCIRAMNYLDLVILFGDIPFTFTRTNDAESLVMPMGERDAILATLIDDLKGAALQMKFANELSDGVERCSKEFAWALTARIALFRGGYSLRHGETNSESDIRMERPADYAEYYKIARDYCDSVITSGKHTLAKDYMKVFYDECNYKVANNDDPIFEIPFVQNVSGNIGYETGPKVNESNAGGTTGQNQWGTSSGGIRLNAFYRFTFDKQDARRDMIGFWLHEADGKPTIQNDRNNYCNKWSKLWDENHTLGRLSSDKTGINFPYMRYADVLLMFAEAENELNNGPTPAAVDAFKQVRARAFRNADNYADMVDNYIANATSKQDFFNLIKDERAWEFGGEAMRWKDLVRWNLYNQVVYTTFWKYYGMAAGDYSYDVYEEFDKYPLVAYYKVADNPGDGSYPNKVLQVLNFWKNEEVDCQWENTAPYFADPDHESEMPPTTGEDPWSMVNWFDWMDQGTGNARADCRNMFRGYIQIDVQGNLVPASMPYFDASTDLTALPPVRYILPIPSDAIARSNGAYKNYYGY